LLLGEEHENRRADVATGSTPARAEMVAEAASRAAECSGEVRGIERRPAPAVTAPSTHVEMLAEAMVEARRFVLSMRRPLLVGAVVGSFSGHVDSLLSVDPM
jgi:hypothetical protein